MGTEGKIQGCLSTSTINHTLLSLNCKESITNAETSAKQIRTVDGGTHINHFQVQSQSKKTWSDLWFGTGNTMPKCSWLGQVRSSMQAIFAAFQHYPQSQLEAFPEKYRENPNLKLDPTNVFLDPTTSKEDIGPTDDFDGNLLHEEAPAEKVTKHKQDQQSQIKQLPAGKGCKC